MLNNPDVAHLLEHWLPGDEVRSVIPLGAGLDNTALLVNDEIVVRQAREPDPDAVRREAALLDLVARHVTLPVPQIVFTDPEKGILSYRALPGTPLIDIPDADSTALAEPLGTFLAAIHAIPLADVEHLVPRDVDLPGEWLDEARAGYEQVGSLIPASARAEVEAFLHAPPPSEAKRLTLCHNDFGAEHILVDPDTLHITGIIDWSDASITDPVRDLALVYRDLGPDALDRAVAAYRTALTDADMRRLVFHARCKLIEDLAYGLESGQTRYADTALAHLEWIFPSGTT